MTGSPEEMAPADRSEMRRLLAGARHREARRAFVEQLLSVLPVDTYDLEVARAHATLPAHTRRSGRPRGSHDLIIAATAVARRRSACAWSQCGLEAQPAAEGGDMSDEDGLVTIRSAHSVPETIERVVSAVTSRGMTVFTRVDHAAGAAKVGLALRPTQVVLFGNPVGGTPLMQDRQTAGIDLPVKALAWEDAGGAVWLTYNDPHWVARRHGLGAASAAAVTAMEAGLAAVTREAATG